MRLARLLIFRVVQIAVSWNSRSSRAICSGLKRVRWIRLKRATPWSLPSSEWLDLWAINRYAAMFGENRCSVAILLVGFIAAITLIGVRFWCRIFDYWYDVFACTSFSSSSIIWSLRLLWLWTLGFSGCDGALIPAAWDECLLWAPAARIWWIEGSCDYSVCWGSPCKHSLLCVIRSFSFC